ncbi:MAG: metallophosphoesterase [Cyanobacteria bacterium P01_A01_bin.135]
MHPWLSGSLSVETLTVSIRGLPSHLNGLVITQLSDLHYDGLRLSQKLLDEAIVCSNQCNPDLVVLTGDHITNDPAPAPALACHVARLQAKAGVYAILGNHDLYYPETGPAVTAAFEAVGVRVLWNEVCYPWGEGLALVGLADYWCREFCTTPLETVPSDTPRLVLSHNPDSAVPLQHHRVDLQMSGHTHGGQIVLPGLGPFPHWYQRLRYRTPKWLRPYIPYMRRDCHKVVKHWEWAQGLHQVGDNTLYVNRGLGTYPPGRLFCPPELTVIRLVAAPRRALSQDTSEALVSTP